MASRLPVELACAYTLLSVSKAICQLLPRLLLVQNIGDEEVMMNTLTIIECHTYSLGTSLLLWLEGIELQQFVLLCRRIPHWGVCARGLDLQSLLV